MYLRIRSKREAYASLLFLSPEGQKCKRVPIGKKSNRLHERNNSCRQFSPLYHNHSIACAGFILGHHDLPVNALFQLRHMGDDAYQPIAFSKA